MKADPGTILATIVVGVVLIVLVVGISHAVVSVVTGFGVTASRHSSSPFDVFGPLSAVLGFVKFIVTDLVGAFIGAGIVIFSLKVARGQPYVFGDLFAGGPFFIPAAIAQFVVSIAIGFGMLFLVVPGVILALGLSMVVPLIVDRGLGPMEAITESWRITDGHKVNLFVFSLLTLGIVVVGLCACGVGPFLASPLVTIAQAYIYLKITNQPVAAIAPGGRPY